MGITGSIMRIFSYLYHVALALFMLGVSVLAWFSGNNLQISILPWEGKTLWYLLFFGAIAGLLFVALAVSRVLPALFLLWTVVVFVMLFRGFVLSPYKFDQGGLTTAVVMTFGALLAIVGAWLQLRSKPLRRMPARGI